MFRIFRKKSGEKSINIRRWRESDIESILKRLSKATESPSNGLLPNKVVMTRKQFDVLLDAMLPEDEAQLPDITFQRILMYDRGAMEVIVK